MPQAPFTIEPVDGGFRLEGTHILRAASMIDWNNDQAVRYFQKRLQRMGVLKALKRLGAEEGQSVFIGDVELEY